MEKMKKKKKSLTTSFMNPLVNLYTLLHGYRLYWARQQNSDRKPFNSLHSDIKHHHDKTNKIKQATKTTYVDVSI